MSVVCVCLMTVMFWGIHSYFNYKEYLQGVIRFHVVANSNTIEDQALKMHVKNAVISAMRDKLENVSTKREALKIIDENLKYIKKVASEQVVNQGKNYEVEVLLDKNTFPIKDYGNITLTAGKYDAVKTIIREGKGKKWWCVLFPPLCFTDGVQTLESEEQLKGLKVFEKDNIEYRLWLFGFLQE